MSGSDKLRHKHAKKVSPGDVLIDREGHEMVVIEVVNKSTGDCYALYNGEIKLINALRSSRVMTKASKVQEYSDAESQA